MGEYNAQDGEALKRYIRDIPDFPKKGIVFRDITPLLANSDGYKSAVDLLISQLEGMPVDAVAAPEARGFIVGTSVASALGVGFIPIRKPGRLPYNTKSYAYEKEYGRDTVEMHSDAVSCGDRILLVDDLLAVGGTANACAELIRKSKGTVAGMGFLIELDYLGGRESILRENPDMDIYSVIRYKE